jgi:hypothetical protein
VTLTYDGREFKQKGTKKGIPDYPTPPIDGWTELGPGQTAALAVIAEMADSEDDSAFISTGIRFHPSWVATATFANVSVAWISDLVTEPMTIPALLLKGLSGVVEFAYVDGVVWLRERETDQYRWSRPLTGDWPDAVVNETLAGYRAQGGRDAFGLKFELLEKLAKDAAIVTDSRNIAKAFTVSDGQIGVGGSATSASYQGTCECGADETVKAKVGVDPKRLAALLSGLRKVTPEEQQYLSVAGEIDALLFWGGDDPVVECMLVAAHLS